MDEWIKWTAIGISTYLTLSLLFFIVVGVEKVIKTANCERSGNKNKENKNYYGVKKEVCVGSVCHNQNNCDKGKYISDNTEYPYCKSGKSLKFLPIHRTQSTTGETQLTNDSHSVNK